MTPGTARQHESALTPELEQSLRQAGATAARQSTILPANKGLAKALERDARRLPDRILSLARVASDSERQWLVDNIRLIRTAHKQVRELTHAVRKDPVVEAPGMGTLPRTCAVARQILDADSQFSEEGTLSFLAGYQAHTDLKMSELWALKPALQHCLLESMAAEGPSNWPTLMTSLRRVSEALWKDLFEAASSVEHVLAADPAGAYARMDYLSRDLYRSKVSELAERSERSERETAELAVEMARAATKLQGEARAVARRTHVGFYLLDRGEPYLRAAVRHRRSAFERVHDFVIENNTAFYLVGVELMTFLIAAALLGGLSNLTPILAGLLLLLLPATQAAVDFMNNLVGYLVPPKPLAKLDFSQGIPDDCAAMVAVPTLLLNEHQVRDLALDVEIRYLANRDPNLYFALLTDSPDSDKPVDDRDALVTVAQELVEGLNARYGVEGRGPFFLFHRHRVFNASEGRWMGWERKRGKLLDLNQLLRGGFDSFPVKIGDLAALPRIRYVITLDSDTQLPRDSAAKLVGAIAHPLNRAVIDPRTQMVVEGYGILQPRIGISIQSASRSRLARIYSGQTGFDIYTRAVSDVYQDLFEEGIFTGKGVYEVDAFHQVLQQRFPENALLSHDLIEGAYARAGLATDVELIDDYPSHFSAYSRRKHRWVRGDWQILRWLLPRVPDFHGNTIANPINLISRWKIIDNLRRSLFEPATLLLLLAGWFYLPGSAVYWTTATIALLLMPVYSNLLFSVLRAPWTNGRALGAWATDTSRGVIEGHIVAALGVLFLLHQALLSLDAIGRSVVRVFVTRRKLLEWETAAEAEAEKRPKSTVDVYLEWTPALALAIGAALWLVRPGSLKAAAPVLAAWFASRWISAWLNRAPQKTNRNVSVEDTALLRDTAERTWRFFQEWSSQANHWLIPDNVREAGTAVNRTSPTNIGFLLNARVAAVHLDLLNLADFVRQTQMTLESLDKLEKFRGHLFNWYEPETLATLEPRFISTVDSGNLAACLWTLKQAARAFAAEEADKRGLTEELSARLLDIAADCDRLVQAMDFSFLYNRRKKVLSVGYDASANRLEVSCYDLLASESRIASFVAIARGDIPQESWFHLDRRQIVSGGEQVLISWTGTMFEYLMPILWMRHYPETITQLSVDAAVRVQQEFARGKGVPWGISESACNAAEGCDYGYAAFGIPELAMKRMDREALVVSPYATFLALQVDPAGAIANIRRMVDFEWQGRYGFYEAVDYTKAGGDLVRFWMAHHQGMTLLAIVNLLFDNVMQQYFHCEPHVLATELLLHERVPTGVAVDSDRDFPMEVAGTR